MRLGTSSGSKQFALPGEIRHAPFLLGSYRFDMYRNFKMADCILRHIRGDHSAAILQKSYPYLNLGTIFEKMGRDLKGKKCGIKKGTYTGRIEIMIKTFKNFSIIDL